MIATVSVVQSISPIFYNMRSQIDKKYSSQSDKIDYTFWFSIKVRTEMVKVAVTSETLTMIYGG